jgi:putative FmdB family regulatory protein
MPVYEFRCDDCGYVFEEYSRSFGLGEASCVSCRSSRVTKLLCPPLIRMGKSSEARSDYSAKDAEVNYYRDRKDYVSAAKAAEKAGKSEWEVKDLYRKAGRKV